MLPAAAMCLQVSVSALLTLFLHAEQQVEKAG
jgi:hypothetical protein